MYNACSEKLNCRNESSQGQRRGPGAGKSHRMYLAHGFGTEEFRDAGASSVKNQSGCRRERKNKREEKEVMVPDR